MPVTGEDLIALLLKVKTMTHKKFWLLHAIVILALNKLVKEIQTHTDKIHNIWVITRILNRRKDSMLQMSESVLTVLLFLTWLDPQQMPKIPEHIYCCSIGHLLINTVVSLVEIYMDKGQNLHIGNKRIHMNLDSLNLMYGML
jgi:hypothetical protein